jgi:hypothetical protein
MRLAPLALLLFTALLATAQWVRYPTPGIPRTKDGKPNLSAKAPRVNGKPDLSGVWHVQPNTRAEMKKFFGDDVDTIEVPGMEIDTITRYAVNILLDYKPEEIPLTPAAGAIMARRAPGGPEALPSTTCMPLGIPLATNVSEFSKIVQTPSLTIIVLELNGGMIRQIHTDGRKLPVDPSPTWLGYSVGKWEGDTLVVDTIGFNDRGWLDVFGHPQSEAMHITERYHRRDFGHLDIEYTFNDPKMYTKPFTVKETHLLQPDTDILEYVCAENERDEPHMGLK